MNIEVPASPSALLVFGNQGKRHQSTTFDNPTPLSNIPAFVPQDRARTSYILFNAARKVLELAESLSSLKLYLNLSSLVLP